VGCWASARASPWSAWASAWASRTSARISAGELEAESETRAGSSPAVCGGPCQRRCRLGEACESVAVSTRSRAPSRDATRYRCLHHIVLPPRSPWGCCLGHKQHTCPLPPPASPPDWTGGRESTARSRPAATTLGALRPDGRGSLVRAAGRRPDGRRGNGRARRNRLLEGDPCHRQGQVRVLRPRRVSAAPAAPRSVQRSTGSCVPLGTAVAPMLPLKSVPHASAALIAAQSLASARTHGAQRLTRSPHHAGQTVQGGAINASSP